MAQLKSYFEAAGVPWIYGNERPDVHMNSTYNRKPKGHAWHNNYETRIATIRKNLATQDERLEKLRMDRLVNKPFSGEEKTMMGVLKALQSEQAAQKFKQQSKSKDRADAVAANKEMGIETRKSSPVKGAKGASKGGQINKKEREVMALAKGVVEGKKEGDE